MLKTGHKPRHDQAERYGVQLGAIVMAAQGSPLPTMITNSVASNVTIVFANEAFLAMTGFSRSGLLASRIDALFGAAVNAKTVVLLKDAIASGGAGVWQASLQRADGASFLAVVYLSPIGSSDNKTNSHLINIFDLASVICLSREMKEVYPAIYDKAPGFIALSEGNIHRFTYTNAAYNSLVKRGGLIGITVAEALPELVGQGMIAILDEVYQTGKPFRASEMPLCICNPESNQTDQRWIDVVYHPVRDENGAITGLFCAGHDVTDLRETNKALAALQMEMAHVSQLNAMGTMAATLAHELNQPLTAISNYLGGVRPLAGQAPDVGRLTEALEGIRDASNRAAAIIDHVRELTKHRKPCRSPFNLRDAADECIRLVRSSCHCQIAFKNRIPADVIMTADLVKIQQVLINLLQNACDATADAPHAAVAIDAIQNAGHLTVCVADSGSGVSPEAVATMFAWAETSKGDGMGIGLSICRTIIELHRGSIWLEQTGPHGSEFRFSVPEPAR